MKFSCKVEIWLQVRGKLTLAGHIETWKRAEAKNTNTCETLVLFQLLTSRLHEMHCFIDAILLVDFNIALEICFVSLLIGYTEKYNECIIIIENRGRLEFLGFTTFAILNCKHGTVSVVWPISNQITRINAGCYGDYTDKMSVALEKDLFVESTRMVMLGHFISTNIWASCNWMMSV